MAFRNDLLIRYVNVYDFDGIKLFIKAVTCCWIDIRHHDDCQYWIEILSKCTNWHSYAQFNYSKNASWIVCALMEFRKLFNRFRLIHFGTGYCILSWFAKFVFFLSLSLSFLPFSFSFPQFCCWFLCSRMFCLCRLFLRLSSLMRLRICIPSAILTIFI